MIIWNTIRLLEILNLGFILVISKEAEMIASRDYEKKKIKV